MAKHNVVCGAYLGAAKGFPQYRKVLDLDSTTVEAHKQDELLSLAKKDGFLYVTFKQGELTETSLIDEEMLRASASELSFGFTKEFNNKTLVSVVCYNMIHEDFAPFDFNIFNPEKL
jgi:hypothetical protein